MQYTHDTRKFGATLVALCITLASITLPSYGFPDISMSAIPFTSTGDTGYVRLPYFAVVPDQATMQATGPILIGALPDVTPLTFTGEEHHTRATSVKSENRLAKALALIGIALIPTDGTTMPKIQSAVGHDRDNTVVSLVNNCGTPQVLVPIIGVLYLSHDSYDKESAKMATVALVDAGVLVQVGKTLAGRARPNTPEEHLGEFTGPRLSSGYASFPSGHTAAAFAVATVLAHRYPKQRWLCYGLASAVGLARVWRSDHFPSDVLVGAGVGVFSGENAMRSGGQLLSLRW